MGLQHSLMNVCVDSSQTVLEHQRSLYTCACKINIQYNCLLIWYNLVISHPISASFEGSSLILLASDLFIIIPIYHCTLLCKCHLMTFTSSVKWQLVSYVNWRPIPTYNSLRSRPVKGLLCSCIYHLFYKVLLATFTDSLITLLTAYTHI